jgi:hypothetical protein
LLGGSVFAMSAKSDSSPFPTVCIELIEGHLGIVPEGRGELV